MKKHLQIKTFIIIFLGALFVWAVPQTHAYSLGLKSRDNSITNIQRVEKTLKTELPLVSFIFHTWDEFAYNTVAKFPYDLGRERIYHITLAPEHYTAQEVADGKADEIYSNFFLLIKENRLKVIFRTMHEMNWWWYPRSSDPTAFKKARIRIRDLSRKAWLTKKEILFDMSLNAWDMPTKDARPNQSSPLMYCYPVQKQKLNCPTFEDYYPWDDYVDILGVSFYNRWKGNTNRLRQAPYEIINNSQWKTLDRMKTFNKPLFVDEVGTTAVRYDEQYNQQKSIETYQTDARRKDAWLDSLGEFLQNESDIIGSIYFNVDLTYWLTNRIVGEADRSIFDPATGKIYEWWKRLLNNANHNKANYSALFNAFWVHKANRWSWKVFVWNAYGNKALSLLKTLSITATTPFANAKKKLENYKQSIDASTALSRSQKAILRNIIWEAMRIIWG